MLNILKKNSLVFFLLTCSLYILSDEDPYTFIDENAQKMVKVLTEDSSYAETLAQWGDSTITTEFPKNKEELSKNVEVKQTLDTGTSKYPISYKLRKSKDGWKIVNIIINGVNLGLTFRNQFQALAVSHNENISDTLRNWVSDAGTAGIT